jgi:hypothetical protein
MLLSKCNIYFTLVCSFTQHNTSGAKLNNKQGHTKQQVQQAVIVKKQETYITQTKQVDDALVYERF